MPQRPSAQRIMNGTYGTLWVDGEIWAECDTFESKVSINYNSVNFANDGATYQKAMGWSGTGTMTIKKIYSRVQNKMAENVRNGIYPRFEMVGKLDDPDAFGAQRVALHDVTIDDFELLKFDQKKEEDEQMTFKFSDYQMLDSVANPQ